MCHGLRYQGYKGFKRKLLMKMEQISCFCATNIICVSNGVMDSLDKDGICSSKMQVVGIGIDSSYFNPDLFPNKQEFRDTYNISKDDFVYIFIG